jgi:hypothetical protein
MFFERLWRILCQCCTSCCCPRALRCGQPKKVPPSKSLFCDLPSRARWRKKKERERTSMLSQALAHDYTSCLVLSEWFKASGQGHPVVQNAYLMATCAEQQAWTLRCVYLNKAARIVIEYCVVFCFICRTHITNAVNRQTRQLTAPAWLIASLSCVGRQTKSRHKHKHLQSNKIEICETWWWSNLAPLIDSSSNIIQNVEI